MTTSASNPDLPGRHLVFHDLSRDFVLYNDQSLSDEPLSDNDINPIDLTNAPEEIAQNIKWCASSAWSSNCDWYFIIMPTGIALLNVFTHTGMFCSKLSFRFVEAFLDAPWRRKRYGS